MEKIEFNIRKYYETDILVIGGGPAGFSAAVNAARHGAKVMLCEKEGCLGGMATTSLVGPFMPCYDPEGKYQVIRGFYDEFVREMVREGGAIHPSEVTGNTSYASYRDKGHAHVTPYNCEVYKRIAEKICVENNVRLLYNTYFQCCRIGENGMITDAIFSGKGGFFSVKARQFIDCTGDADVAVSAGAPYVEAQAGEIQPVSIFFILDGIDKEPLDLWNREHKENVDIRFFADKVREAREKDEYSVPRHNVEFYEELDGSWRVNMAQVNDVDITDPEQTTEAMIKLRKQIPEIIGFISKTVPGCKNARLRVSSSVLGVRESRRIEGSFTLKGSDLITATPFEDSIFMCGNIIDIHQDKAVYYPAAICSEPYQVPYRVLLPQNVENLLVAGRCISADREAIGAIRVMPPCFAMGQAAGTAAAICISENTIPKYIDIQHLQQLLRADDAILSIKDIR